MRLLPHLATDEPYAPPRPSLSPPRPPRPPVSFFQLHACPSFRRTSPRPPLPSPPHTHPPKNYHNSSTQQRPYDEIIRYRSFQSPRFSTPTFLAAQWSQRPRSPILRSRRPNHPIPIRHSITLFHSSRDSNTTDRRYMNPFPAVGARRVLSSFAIYRGAVPPKLKLKTTLLGFCFGLGTHVSLSGPASLPSRRSKEVCWARGTTPRITNPPRTRYPLVSPHIPEGSRPGRNTRSFAELPRHPHRDRIGS